MPRLIKTPQVEQVAMQGLTALPLHAALRPDHARQVQLPPQSLLDARQQLLFCLDSADATEDEQ